MYAVLVSLLAACQSILYSQIDFKASTIAINVFTSFLIRAGATMVGAILRSITFTVKIGTYLRKTTVTIGLFT